MPVATVLGGSVVSDSWQSPGLQPARPPCRWDPPGKNTGVGCHALLQGIFPNQRLNPGLPHCRKILYCLSYLGSPVIEYILCVKTCTRRRRWHPTLVLLPGKSHEWRSLVGCSQGVVKSQTRLSDFTFTFHFHALEKEMATHSSVLAWRIPGTG